MSAGEGTDAPEGDIIIRREGAVGVIRLNRPRAINAVTLEMIRAVGTALDAFAADPKVALVLLEGAGERGLCAGGDIRGLYDSARAGGDLGKVFWAEEYVINARIAGFAKPYVAFMDGIVMGGGVGLACHGSHRIATDRTRIGMPEVGLGFFPDVGGTWLLSRAPGELGTYLGLTGQTANGSDAVASGLADVLVPAAAWPDLRAALVALPATAGHDAVQACLAQAAVTPPPGPIAAQRAAIDRLFVHGSVEAIVAALDADGSEFAQATRKTMLQKSPRGLKVTLRLLREARGRPSLKDCLVHEYRAALEVFASADFVEGVRAAVIDKDRNPRFAPPTLAEVTPKMVARYFAPRTGDELVFPD